MAGTVLDMYADALAEIRGTQPGQVPSGPMQQFIQRKQAQMLRSWSANRLRLFFIPEAPYSLSASVGSYQIGPGAAQFDTNTGNFVKPVFVQAAYVIVGTARRIPLNILTRPEWNVCQTRSIPDPDGPLDLFYDFNSPIATINVAPIPGNSQQMYMSQWNPLKVFEIGEEALSPEDFYPAEYIRAITLGLAIELSSSYGFSVTPELAQKFQNAIGIVEQMNNSKLSGAFGFTRTLEGPTKGDGVPIQQQANPQQQGQ